MQQVIQLQENHQNTNLNYKNHLATQTKHQVNYNNIINIIIN